MQLGWDLSGFRARRITDAGFAQWGIVAVPGAIYCDVLAEAREQGRITGAPHDIAAPVFSYWDIGIADSICILLVQRCGRKWHAIDYYEQGNKTAADASRLAQVPRLFLRRAFSASRYRGSREGPWAHVSEGSSRTESGRAGRTLSDRRPAGRYAKQSSGMYAPLQYPR